MSTVREWSTETLIADHRELQCTSLSVSPGGDLVALSGRKHLALLSLTDPTQVLKKMCRGTRWNCTKLAWNPSQYFSNYILLATNDKIEVYTISQTTIEPLDPIRGHCRQISDICLSVLDGSMVGSTDGNGSIHVWDIRDYKRPCISFQTMIGANQIQWSRANVNLLAGAHEGDIKLWDTRHPSSFIVSSTPHTSRIQSVDWMSGQNSLITSSSDCTVKLHTFSEESGLQTAENGLKTSIPVWRAKFTPFGEGMVTVLVPQLGTPEHSIFLWNTGNLSSPVHTFVGHRDDVLDFEWRMEDDWQLVSWSRDQTIRVWNCSNQIQARCGSVEEESSADQGRDALNVVFQLYPDEPDSLTELKKMKNDPTLSSVFPATSIQTDPAINRNADRPLPKLNSRQGSASSFADLTEKFRKEQSPRGALSQSDSSGALENTLQQEFALLDTNFSFIRIVEKDLQKRVCRIVANTFNTRLIIQIWFPSTYPVNTPPVFSFLQGSTIKSELKVRLLNLLKETAQHLVGRNRACLERCLRILECQLAVVHQENSLETVRTNQKFPFQNVPLKYQDNSVPYPRTAGARFCSNNLLVCFGRPTYKKKIKSINGTGPTPRAYSAYISLLASRSEKNLFPSLALSSLPEQQDRQLSTLNTGRFKVRRVGTEDKFVRRRKSVQLRNQSVSLTVTVYSVERLLPVSLELAEHCVIKEDTVQMCLMNSDITESLNRPDLAHIWKVLGEVARSCEIYTRENEQPWSRSPLGTKLIQSIIRHFINCHDFQTIALIVCAFTKPTCADQVLTTEKQQEKTNPAKDRFWFLRPGGLTNLNDSPYHTVHAGRIENFPGKNRTGGSNPNLDKSWSKNIRSNSWTDILPEEIRYSLDEESPQKPVSKTSVGELKFGLLAPEQIDLYSDALNVYANLLYNGQKLQKRCEVLKHGVYTFSEEPVSVGQLESPKDCAPNLICELCRLPVRGFSCICPSCEHGGHAGHWMEWFRERDVCPTGCGCHCFQYMS